MTSKDSEIERLVSHVRCLIDLDNAKLSDEFYPAHLSVALIDAIFTPRLHYYKNVVPIIERYCERFKLRRMRQGPNRAKLPSVEEQETLTDLIDHFYTLGSGGFQQRIVQSRYLSPGTSILKSENVKRAAIELRGIGVETLQDVQCKSAKDIKCVLRPLPGIGDRTIHMFLMYAGDNSYVKGDVHVCRFVATALGLGKISANEAEKLVSSAAYVLGISPRLLDYEIWKHGAILTEK